MTSAIARLLGAAVLPSDDEVSASRKRLATGGAGLATPFLMAIGVVYIAFGEYAVGGLYAGYALWACIQLALFLAVHRQVPTVFWALAIPALLVHLLVILQLGDLVQSGAVVLWGLAFPIATGVVFVPARRLAPLFALYTVNVFASVLVTPSHRSSLPTAAAHAILMANILALSALAVVILALFVNARDHAFRLLGNEQAKVRRLLLSILPEQIADELTGDPHVIADQFEQVSVLFADVTGFTPMSATMGPAEIVEVLDDLFACFDDLVDSAGLEKIKTIGDCYMVAAGVPTPRVDHATALVALGLEMQSAAQSRLFQGRRLQLRIGVNSGPVVAGVIGRRKFSYDLWGDVVNVASRMESHGVAGAVQITEPTYALVHDSFRCEPRGLVEVKGKGSLPTWLITHRIAATGNAAIVHV